MVFAGKCHVVLVKLIHHVKYWQLILLLSLPVLVLGVIGSARFNDGVWHLKCVRAWCELGGRPIQIASKNNFSIYHEESPLWYFINFVACIITGGYSYYTVQIIQTLLFAIILFLVYILTKTFASGYHAKLAVLLAGMTPILPVCAVLTFIDLLCAVIILLAVLLLVKRQFWWCALTLAGLWYSKRTGMVLIPLFFIMLTVICFVEYRSKKLRALLTVLGCGVIIIALVFPDIIFRAEKFGSDDMIVRELAKISNIAGYHVNLHPPPLSPPSDGVVIKYVNEKDVAIPELVNYYYAASNRPAALIPLPNFIQWFGFAVPLLFILMLWQLIQSRFCRHELWRRYNVLAIPLLVFFLLWFMFARRYGRYLVVIFPIATVLLSLTCNFRRCRWLFCVVSVIVLVQYLSMVTFVAKTAPLDSNIIQVISYLKAQPVSGKIFWEEWELASYYIPGTDATWTHEIFSSNAIVKNLLANNIKTVVVAKRFNYNFSGAIYDKGWPYHILAAFERTSGVDKVVDNPQYSIYRLR